MSNTKQPGAAGPFVPAGDMGIGLCLQCLGEVITKGADAPVPRFGVTLAPMLHNMMTAAGPIMGLVAVPACWEHLSQTAGNGQQQEQRRPLLVANGKLP